MRTVAALYIDPRGPYPSMPGVECWDEQRDARNYAGPHPVVAHPPCGSWGSLAHMAHLVHKPRGGEHGYDRDCAPRAVEQVRRWGGVLEHPANSRLWAHCCLPRPGELPDEFGAVTLEVRQVDWGHVAEKRTWLYLAGVRLERYPRPEPRTPTHWISGRRSPRKDRGWRGGGVAPPSVKFCSSAQRRRTPPAFAEFLVGLARSVRV